jgi:hypothetical protein
MEDLYDDQLPSVSLESFVCDPIVDVKLIPPHYEH